MAGTAPRCRQYRSLRGEGTARSAGPLPVLPANCRTWATSLADLSKALACHSPRGEGECAWVRLAKSLKIIISAIFGYQKLEEGCAWVFVQVQGVNQYSHKACYGVGGWVTRGICSFSGVAGGIYSGQRRNGRCVKDFVCFREFSCFKGAREKICNQFYNNNNILQCRD